MKYLLAFLMAVAVHELGHIITARIFGVPLISVSGKTAGLSMAFDFSGVSFPKEAAVHMGGVAAGLLSAVLSCFLPYRFFRMFAGMSLSFGVLNLLPLSSFDGGGIVRAVLSQFFYPDTVWRITRIVSWITLILLWTAVLWAELRVQPNLGLIFFVIVIMVEEWRK